MQQITKKTITVTILTILLISQVSAFLGLEKCKCEQHRSAIQERCSESEHSCCHEEESSPVSSGRENSRDTARPCCCDLKAHYNGVGKFEIITSERQVIKLQLTGPLSFFTTYSIHPEKSIQPIEYSQLIAFEKSSSLMPLRI